MLMRPAIYPKPSVWPSGFESGRAVAYNGRDMETEFFSKAREPDLIELLKRFFGYESFRPLQEEIMRDALAGHDTFVLMPTGGGKSLCYQLPALAKGGLTIVVSPLIALMKDQVDALHEAGVSATFLNSTLNAAEARRRLAGLYNGEFRLLYVAPERLMLPEMLERLVEWQPGLIAIDEAHCISEWGHDFRPEYRQIAELRGRFPETPLMALTATATERVRADIVLQLNLSEPRRYVASFNRANLTYRVIPRNQPLRQVLDVVRRHNGESGIVYCGRRAGTERLANRLTDQGIRAVSYHAGLDAGTRAKNQEAFIRDDVQIVCATIAFGMGIDKPDVRFVIHYDLPKNIEGYYQETGRAGRDGLPADCVLLFNASDVAKQIGFIEEKTDEHERTVARQLLQQMVHFAETSDCRRRSLLDYFSEAFTGKNCGACDNCLEPKETFDGTEAAQKFLACLYRIREKSGFGFGLNHVVEVLTGADTEAIRKWGHDQVSTHGIGDEFGRDVAKPKSRERRPRSARAGEIQCDEMLFERLREMRQELASGRGVPAYMIFGDVALREMARDCPATMASFGLISGVGEKKKAEYGKIFISEIAAYLDEKG